MPSNRHKPTHDVKSFDHISTSSVSLGGFPSPWGNREGRPNPVAGTIRALRDFQSSAKVASKIKNLNRKKGPSHNGSQPNALEKPAGMNALLSLLLPGFGQLENGQPLKAGFFAFFAIVTWAGWIGWAGGIGWLFHIWAAADAWVVADRTNKENASKWQHETHKSGAHGQNVKTTEGGK